VPLYCIQGVDMQDLRLRNPIVTDYNLCTMKAQPEQLVLIKYIQQESKENQRKELIKNAPTHLSKINSCNSSTMSM
jgi:hypothetical protein